MEVEIKKIFPAKRPDDGRHPWITAALYLEDGRIFLTDYNNPRMLVYDEDGVLLTEILLIGNPRDLTRLGNDTVIMTLPDELMLQTVHLETMKAKLTIHVGYECSGITSKDEKLFLACGKHITVMNINGQILHTMKIRDGNAIYICCDGNDKLFYTGYRNDKLYCINLDGIILFVFESIDLKFCRGVTLDSEGNALVAGRWTHNVFSITPEGEFKEEHMNRQDGLDFPLYLTYRDKSSSKFLVLNNNGKNVMMCQTIDEEEKEGDGDVILEDDQTNGGKPGLEEMTISDNDVQED